MYDNRMSTTKFWLYNCESGLTDVKEKPRIIQEDTIEIPGDEYKEAHKVRRVRAESVLQTAGVKNRNGRIYPGEELFPQSESERTKQLIEHGYFCGEAGHPLDATLVR